VKNVLALIGSPRRLGNCEIMAKEISRNITADHQLDLIRLSEFNIRPCRGCYTCLFKDRCVIDDDYYTVAEAIVAADALIVTAPTYFLGPNSVLKSFTDRGLALYGYAETLWGKPGVAVGIAGIAGKEGYTLLGIENFLKMVFADIRRGAVVYGALPGEVFLNEKNRVTAAELARALFETTPDTDPSRCTLCGGQTFRFLGANRVRCMLCSTDGTLKMEEGNPRFDMHRGEHEFFLTLQDAIEHRDWLVGMKSRFLKEKDRLKRISLDYRRDGRRITPGTGA
jgi:multimeric flavodoxin WrbA